MIHSTVWSNDTRGNAKQWSTVQCEAMVLSAMLIVNSDSQYKAIIHSALSNDLQYNLKQWSTVQCEAMILGAMLSNDPQYSVKQWYSGQC